jgi:hypothetical protein
MTNLQTRVTRIHLTPDTTFNDSAFSVEIDDEGGGEFIVVRSLSCEPGAPHALAIDPCEWPALRDAIDLMMKNVRA